MKTFFFLLLFFNMITFSDASLKKEEIEYKTGGATMKGYLTYDDSIKKKRPGILVVHEWWGQNEYTRTRARMLAQAGYTAFAIDMYGEGKTAIHPKKAGEYMRLAFKNWSDSKARFNEALKVLRMHQTVDSTKIASIGYCFGGTVSIKMALSGINLNGIVAFHSALPLEPPITKGKLKTAFLVGNGSEDAFIKSETVASFMKNMYEANADLTYLNLAGVKHSFTNPMADELGKKFNIPNLKYNKGADQRSWLAMNRFFDRIFSEN